MAILHVASNDGDTATIDPQTPPIHSGGGSRLSRPVSRGPLTSTPTSFDFRTARSRTTSPHLPPTGAAGAARGPGAATRSCSKRATTDSGTRADGQARSEPLPKRLAGPSHAHGRCRCARHDRPRRSQLRLANRLTTGPCDRTGWRSLLPRRLSGRGRLLRDELGIRRSATTARRYGHPRPPDAHPRWTV